MKYRTTALFLAAVMAAALMTGCGSKGTIDSTEAEETTTDQIANPWQETDEAGVEATIGVAFDEPEGAQDVVYSICEDEGLAQMKYTDADGTEICVRAKVTGSLEDISGLYYDSWTDEGNCTIGTCEGTIQEVTDNGTTIQLCTWFDAVPGISYSVEASGESLDGFDIAGVAEQVYHPEQGEATGSEFDAVTGTYTCDYDESTMEIREDGSVAVSLTRLCSIEGTASMLEDGNLELLMVDPNYNDMVMEFNTATGELTVTDSSWELLENGTSYTFAKDDEEAATEA